MKKKLFHFTHANVFHKIIDDSTELKELQQTGEFKNVHYTTTKALNRVFNMKLPLKNRKHQCSILCLLFSTIIFIFISSKLMH